MIVMIVCQVGAVSDLAKFNSPKTVAPPRREAPKTSVIFLSNNSTIRLKHHWLNPLSLRCIMVPHLKNGEHFNLKLKK